MPRGVVVDDRFDWEGDVAPNRSRSESVIYEAHVRNQTALHPGVPPELRGTYAGLAHPASVAHLTAQTATLTEAREHLKTQLSELRAKLDKALNTVGD